MSDSVVRAMTDSGAFRVIAARTTQAVAAAAAAQQVSGLLARQLGELLTGAVLFRELMSPAHRVQCVIEGAGGKGRIVADAHPDGGSRGLVVAGPGGGGIQAGEGAVLRMARAMPRGGLQEGVVALAAGRAGLSEALMRYLQESEQVVAAIAVGTVLEGDAVVAAGGWVVQLLPETDRANLAVMTERLADFEAIDSLLVKGSTPAALLEEILYGWPYTQLGESPLSFRCRCSQAGVEAAIATLDSEELESVVRDDQALEIRCDYCRQSYEIGVKTVARILEERRRIN